ncbi:MAG: ATP-dependent DNA helicase RecG [Anaerolineales bacterium]|nr:ATP-dependent DNA helicase RecG [Anaerolineales bacterium]
MNKAIEKLAKFLRLEADRGYDNRAVFGGLQNMLEPWEEEARDSEVPEQIIQVVISRLRDYPKLSPQSRQDALNGLWIRLSKKYPELERETLGTSPTPLAEESAEEAIEADGEPTTTPTTAVEEPVMAQEAKPITSVETAPARETPSPPPPSKPVETPLALEAPLTTLPGVGPKTAKTLKKLDLESLGDLLWHLPRRYDDYSQLKTINRLWYGEDITVIGTVEDITVRTVRNGRMKLVEAVIGDGTGSLKVTWFNQPWIADKLKPGRGVVLSGKVDQYLGRLTMNSPEWEPLERIQLHTNRIVPVYPLTAGVTGKWLRRVINSVVTRYANRVPDPIPSSVLESEELVPLGIALQQIHFPDNWESLESSQNRIAFDEMFLLQLGVLRQKRDWQELKTKRLPSEQAQIDRFLAALPFKLTDAQKKALGMVRTDLESDQPMNRLLQGDVGSGKTVIAAAAITITAANDAQSAFLAPTSILAEQHYNTLLTLLPEGAGISPTAIRLLLGATPNAEKEEIRQGLSDGTIKIVIGTHALLEDPIEFKQLGLAVIDEQHRFGVNQRALLRAKGHNPNLLVMTATPIPRSLALTIYGDLDLAIIDEMPPGRKPVETMVLMPFERTRAYQFIQSHLENSEQAFIIYPLVEESEKIEAKAAVDEFERLQSEVFQNYSVGLLHGRMKQDEKEEVMQGFRSGQYDILVSTSVVEVGVDIPNATVMLIEGANRFGLAQLHQFRGRVGRDESLAYCLLIPDTTDNADNERLKAMESTQDGFELAEIDLNHRGPGDFLGTRQSGFAELRMARITDIHLIEKAREAAKGIFAKDPDLMSPEHQALAEVMLRFWTGGRGEIS